MLLKLTQNVLELNQQSTEEFALSSPIFFNHNILIGVKPVFFSQFYNILNKNNDKPTSKSKWENIYDIEEDTWKDIYSSPFKLNVGTNLQWFQTRINHRLLPTKKYLYTINASPN